MPKILLVEDNDINRDMLSRRLERKGYQVIIAVNGTEAVAKTLSDRPDIVLMDLHIPILDGWAATRQLKANPQTQIIPVIALTADASAGEREKALAAGCDEYDTKPVDLPRLLQKITKLLEPVIVPAPAPPNSPPDPRLQQIFLNRLRHQLDPPIDRIIGYSDLLLDLLSDSARRTLRERQQPELYSDIQKIHSSGMRILQLVQAMLNPVLLELQQQEINIFTPILRLEILTPLSTIIGYCEMLLEEAATDLIPDLEQIYTSAQDLLNVVNSLDSPLAEHLPWRIALQPISLQSLDPDYPSLANDWTRIQPIDPPRCPIATDRRILIIDDNESSATLLSRQLERYGFQVKIAAIDRVLDSLAAMPSDLILLEIGQTGRGLQMLAQLKQDEWRHIPVLLLAAPDRLDLVVQGIEMGAAEYLTRPFQSVLLQTKISACLELQRQQGQDQSFDSLFENAPVGVYQATVTGCYRRVNPALVELLGYPDAATLMGMVTDIAVGAASRSENRIYVDRNRHTDFKTMLAEHDRVIGFEYQAYRYDGDPIWIAEHARAVRDREGNLVAYEGIVEDISQRKQAESELQPQLAALQLELANIKRNQQVAEIVQTDYFQQLQSNGEASTAGEVAPMENGASSLQSFLPLKVLLVEDNELNSDMLSRRLQRAGYAVVVASDGADGVAQAILERPDLILMDISLPIMDGWEATQQIKANAQTAHIPIIALTAHAMAGDREKALAAGCNDYDTKPVELPRLLGKIEGCLKRSISN